MRACPELQCICGVAARRDHDVRLVGVGEGTVGDLDAGLLEPRGHRCHLGVLAGADHERSLDVVR
jgi:hypothetical protein